MGRAMTNREWWEKRFNMLVDQAEPLVEIHPGVVYEKSGLWPAIKLAVMKYALGFYGPILRSQREAGNWDALHFIDLCAGSGLTKLTSKKGRGDAILTGTAIIGAREECFDQYHFVEPLASAAEALEARLRTLLPEERFTIHTKERAEAIPLIAEDIRTSSKNPHFLAFIDPEGFTEVTLPHLLPLLDLGRGDFMFNYQHQAAKRAPDQATAFFGSDEWDRHATDEEIADFFLKQLREMGRPKTAAIDVRAGAGSGRYAYKMVYAAAETLSDNPWLSNLQNEINRRCEGVDGAVLDDLLFGGQQTLF